MDAYTPAPGTRGLVARLVGWLFRRGLTRLSWAVADAYFALYRLRSKLRPRALAAVCALALLPGCVGPLRSLNPLRDQTAETWCAKVQRGQAVYSTIVADLEPLVRGSDWSLQYGIAKGIVDLLGARLVRDCQDLRDGYDLGKEDIAFQMKEGAAALGDLVALHQSVTSPVPEPGSQLRALSAGLRQSHIPHAALLEELRTVEAEAGLVLAKR